MNGQIMQFWCEQRVADGKMTKEKERMREIMSESSYSGKPASTVRLRKRHRPTAKVAMAVEQLGGSYRGHGLYGQRLEVKLLVPRRQLRKFLGGKSFRYKDRSYAMKEVKRRRLAERRAEQQEIRDAMDEMEERRREEVAQWKAYEEEKLKKLRAKMKNDLRRTLEDDLGDFIDDDFPEALDDNDDFDPDEGPEEQYEDRHGSLPPF